MGRPLVASAMGGFGFFGCHQNSSVFSSMAFIPQISSVFIEKHTDFPTLITSLKQGFSNKDVLVPLRHHHDFPSASAERDSTLLLMPAWHPSQAAGVKIITVSPNNQQFKLPAIQGLYLYLDPINGTIKAIIEAKSLTAKRTAAASALASCYLSREDSSSLLMIGTGALSKNLILAHASVRPIETVYVWGRNSDNARLICEELSQHSFAAIPVENITDRISQVDIISCATLSPTPLVFGKYLRRGQHLDLVGAYKKDMRESDDDAILKSSLFVDTYEGGLKESGDIFIPLQKGIIKQSDIQADLFEMCDGSKKGRENNNEITIFKSVGHALEDLIAATYYYEKWEEEKR